MASFNPLNAQSAPIGSDDFSGCLKVVKPDFVDCWDCWEGDACSAFPNRSLGCFGDCAKPCGTCVRLTLEGDLYKVEVFDPDGNLIEVIEGVVSVTTTAGEGDDGHPFTRFHLNY